MLLIIIGIPSEKKAGIDQLTAPYKHFASIH